MTEKKTAQIPTLLQQKNMLLIAGDGRNVGKTFLACELIRKLSPKGPIVGIKISPHFHTLDSDDEILYKEDHFTIVNETRKNTKDSSLMLQAGADEVYYIMAKEEGLKLAFEKIADKLEKGFVIAESGGLIEFVDAGIFIFVKWKDKEITSKLYLKYKPLIIERGPNGFAKQKLEDLMIEISKI